MPLVTTCPACSTQFEISATELDAHAGLVRCGACAQVFDANGSLTQHMAPAETPVHSDLASAGAMHSEEAPADPPSDLADGDIPERDQYRGDADSAQDSVAHDVVEHEIVEHEIVEHEIVEHAAKEPDSADPPLGDADSADTDSADTDAAGTNSAEKDAKPAGPMAVAQAQRYDTQVFSVDWTATQGLTAPESRAASEAATDAMPTQNRLHPQADASLDAIAETHTDTASLAMPAITADEVPHFVPAFLADVPASTSKSGRFKQVLMGLFLVLALVAASGQAIYLLRVPLADRFPIIRPWLIQACVLLRCTLRWPEDITALAIDDADVQEHPERTGVLVFSSVLVNHSHRTLAFPVIELTLTDGNDAPLLRRHFSASQYLPQSTHAEDGIAAQQTIAVKLLLAVDAPAVAGFHASIAYPSSPAASSPAISLF